ncbi:DNA-directed RNA polymerase I subunit RPA2 [Lasiodiplodia hormozganensis]|uniref:DNA-directed RNA polymerase n=2 Tax=Lasiodiplodia TaxID=66739 RepID=A0A5N5DEM1_9PEZI|nr:DNA-directed RNA polymerase i subunit Rpa2 [Lasiodiplodia theobromae]KAB2575542.1 DNA-directed RNA polymerase I subunit RPA2 [Lasiodiplodia theobromae]KAF4536289.1 DNA-directed RNA polymerase i subunit Rpa2 [Lasiodiplodia theobromae]KAK0658743.1 DNA-directed RNA polymerase I subunit RPA2 [Lasiodiplodia hormozganensis]
MAPSHSSRRAKTDTAWDNEYDTVRRHNLFQNPPTDHTAFPTLAAAIEPHTHSFNAIFAKNGLLENGLKDIGIKTFLDGDSTTVGPRNRLSVRVRDIYLEKAVLPTSNKIALNDRRILPSECRERHATYRGKMRARLEWRINSGEWQSSVRELGQVPIMLRTNKCHLEGLTPSELVCAKEETEELGGYFIVNGNEKLIRMLIVGRRNFPMAIIRPSFKNRGQSYTKFGIQLRSVRPDQTSQTNVLHYLSDGNVTFRFSWRKNEYLIPVTMILKALVDTNDREIFEGLVGAAGSKGLADKQFVTDRVELLLRTYKAYGIHSKAKTRAYLGSKFRVVLGVPDDTSDEDAGTEFLRRIVLPHLGSFDVTENDDRSKFKLLLFMIRKLYALVEGECAVDDPDAVSNQEILLGGFLYGMIIKEKIEDWLMSIRVVASEWCRNTRLTFTDPEFEKDFLPKIVRRTNENIGNAMEYFLSTGNLLEDSVVVQLDGRVLGYCSPKQAKVIHDTLRYWKVEGTHNVPKELELGYIPNTNGGQYPGIYMFSQPARMYRPVKYLPLDSLDYVGPFEQPYMSIACTEPEIVSGDSTHVEFDPTNILSVLAAQTPYSDYNQSPRNMYQCQMAKQTMGTAGSAIAYRTDNKSYRLQTGQTPIARPPLYNEYGFDNFPNGMNGVVAVISYVGYDMDDGFIMNKSSHERGYGHGTVYKTKKIELNESSRTKGTKKVSKLFGFAPDGLIKAEWRLKLDDDGLPHIGTLLQKGDVLCAYHHVTYDAARGEYINKDGQTHFEKYKDDETGFVEQVRLIGSETGNEPLQAISLTIRISRSPVIGDKFSSRHGQKGVMSQKWPGIDMPFTESGIQPDTIINPHAFPSRMTIGMFVESLAGKAGALHGLAQDSTPFRFDERNTAVDYFGEQLAKAGYNYYGNEPMYSGITGEELHADIYIGVVYYQRLRHMVNDKYQVRTTGPNNALTGQPIKGRKKGGGIRIGEMERDALLAHGTAHLLQDRLMNCSDYTRAWVCRECGSFLSTAPTVNGYGRGKRGGNITRCRRCAKPAEGWEPKSEVWEDGQGMRFTGGENVSVVAIPGVLRYLDVELASMGVKMKFNIGEA